MTNNRVIGKVLSVDNFRVYIKIDEEHNGPYTSGIHDIYEIARINSYLIIPVGADRVVALITRITMKEELEFDSKSSGISLPNSARYISATMLGTITKDQEKEIFIQGVYNFPALDNPVWYVTEKDLRQIFDDKEAQATIDYQKDFYLPVGSSPVFSNYKVKICPDQFFVKHAAILGNTGSGKSCTFTSIIRNLFRYSYSEGKLENAHFVIFDTNGEYKEAFLPKEPEKQTEANRTELKQINAYYYGGVDKVQIPYWFMNWSDFSHLLHPSEGTQAPVLNRAIGLAKNEQDCQTSTTYNRMDIQRLSDLYNHIENSGNDYWKIKNYKDSIDDIKSRNLSLPGGTLVNDTLSQIYVNQNNDYRIPTSSELQPVLNELSKLISLMIQENEKQHITSEQNIDMPIWFNYRELCTKFINAAIEQEGRNNNRISEFLSTLRLRMNSFLNDKRMAIPLMLKDSNENNKEILSQFIAFLLGDFNRYFLSTDKNSFVKIYNEGIPSTGSTKTNQISIIDVSELPFEVLETVTALIGRIIIEFVSHFLPDQRGKYPIVIVLEEAQNYIAENSESVAKNVFERIAREGRKYGISLVVCSQRPSELSKTVLSQCNSFVIHRLQNPEDQKYVKGLVSSASADILDQLPIIPQQHAIITGDCVRTPIQVHIDHVNPTPNSHNPEYIKRWLSDMEIPYESTCNKWLNKGEPTQ